MASAEEELECLSKLAPASSQKLGEEVLAHAPRRSEPVSAGQAGHMADLWGSDFNLARAAASHILSLWRIPICGSIEDFILLDDFINRFAPAGEFPATGEWAAVGKAEVETVTRAIALHLGDIIVKNGAGSWADVNPDHRVLQLGKAGTRVPIEAFVRERILLGASGDNFSSLESLISEAREGKELFVKPELPQWWSEASVEERAEFLARAAAGKKRLTEMGAELSGKLGDLEEIDRVIEAYFEPGGVVKDGMEPTVGESVEQFIVETALYLGSLVMQAVSVTWFTHEQPEGISVYHPGLGRIFPISKMQRRVYLSSAADFSVRLSSFAFGVAAVAVQEGIKANRYGDVDQVCDALIGMIPSMKEFPESELQGVAQSLLGSRG